MRLVAWTDEYSKKRWAWVRDNEPDSMARYGIPAGPPDLDLMDWDGIKREIGEVLEQQGIFSWQDWQRNPTGAQSAMNVIKRHLIRLYREAAVSNNGGNPQ